MPDSVLGFVQRLDWAWPWAWLALPLPLVWTRLLRHAPLPPAGPADSVRVPNLPALLGTDAAGPRPARQGRAMRLLFAAAWFGLVLATARPELRQPAPGQAVSVRDLVLVLDVSASMAAEDMVGDDGTPVSRLVAMQAAVRGFIAARPDDNIGLVVFGSQAYPFAPLSRDHRVLLARVDDLRPGMAGPQTAVGDALGSTVKMFRSLAASGGTDGSPPERMVVMLTDGRDTASTLPPQVALRLARQEGVVLHTIAIGESGDGTLDLPLLRRLAADTGGTFHLVANRTAALQSVYAALDRMAPRRVVMRGTSYRAPLYPFALAAALVLLGALGVQLRRTTRDLG